MTARTVALMRRGMALRCGLFSFIALAVSWPMWVAERGAVTDFYFFVYGGSALAGTMPGYHAGALHLYATAPQLQIGPLPLLCYSAVGWLPIGPLRAVWLGLIMGCGLATVIAVDQLRIALGARRAAWWRSGIELVAVAGAFAAIGWFGHLDDALAITGIAWAAVMISRRSSWWAPALMLGLAAMCKPWAVVTLPMLLALPRPHRLRAGIVWFAAAAGPWLPFLLADNRTAHALATLPYRINAWSGLRVLGLHAHAVAPVGLHAAEIAAGLLLGLVAVRRGQWLAVPLIALTSRMVLEPKFFLYYAAAPIVAALLWEARSRLPVWTLLVAALQVGAVYVLPARWFAVGQVVLAVVVLARFLVVRRRPERLRPDDLVRRVGTSRTPAATPGRVVTSSP